MIKKLTLLPLFLFLLSRSVFSQDPSFSQFYANRVYLNPAFTGIQPGIAFFATSRLQWLKVDNGFKTHAATAEIRVPFLRSGFGLTVSSDQEGIAALTTTGVGASYAYTIASKKSNLHVGFHGYHVWKTFDWDKLIFSDQLDPVLGVVQPSVALPILEKTSFTDISAGVLFRTDTDLKIGKNTYEDIRSSIGASIHHGLSLFSESVADESFQKLITPVPPRLTVHLGTVIPVKIYEGGGDGKRFALSPNFKFDVQGRRPLKFDENLMVVSGGVYVLHRGFHFGAFYQSKRLVPDRRNTNALIFSTGWYADAKRSSAGRGNQKLFIGLSVDVNTSGVGSQGGNVYEVNLRYVFPEASSLLGGGAGGAGFDHPRRKGPSVREVLDCADFLF